MKIPPDEDLTDNNETRDVGDVSIPGPQYKDFVPIYPI